MLSYLLGEVKVNMYNTGVMSAQGFHYETSKPVKSGRWQVFAPIAHLNDSSKRETASSSRAPDSRHVIYISGLIR